MVLFIKYLFLNNSVFISVEIQILTKELLRYYCNPSNNFIYSIFEVIKLLCLNATLAISCLSVERSVYWLKRIKTYLHLRCLFRIYVHKAIINELENTGLPSRFFNSG